jgi:hypothetical protein
MTARREYCKDHRMFRRIILIAALVIGAANTYASDFDPCEPVLRELGIEWEIHAGAFLGERFGLKYGRDFYVRVYAKPSSSSTGFRKLYGLYGKDAAGNWHSNLIPARIAERSAMRQLLKKYKKLRLSHNAAEYKLEGVDLLEPLEYAELLRDLFERRGKFHDDIKLRKNALAWAGLDERFAGLVPEELAEEWRRSWAAPGNKQKYRFLGFEVAPAAPFQNFHDAQDFLRFYWHEINLFTRESGQAEHALRESGGQVHWIANPQGLSPDRRLVFYEGVIGFWGDQNDSHEVNRRNIFGKRTAPDGSVALTAEEMEIPWDVSLAGFGNYSISILTRKTYRKAQPHADGIIVTDRSGLDPSVDPNFPPDFKRLSMGLRGAYGQTTVPEGSPVPISGLEARNDPTLERNVRSLPAKISGKPEVDMPALIAHATPGERGFIADKEGLRARAVELGVDPDIIDDASSVIARQPYSAGVDHVRGVYFLPLTDWLNHPLVQRNLNVLASAGRGQALKRYNDALERYKRRLSDIAKARKNPYYQYRPDVTDNWRQFNDGINRIYPREWYPEFVRPGESSSEPNLWFERLLIAESYRFIAESGIADLLAMPQ